MRRKKLLLINPGNPWFFYFTPPLGLGYVAAVTPENWDVEIVDEKTRRFNFATVKADLVGISVMTPQARRAYEIAGQFTRRNIPVVLGGIHVSMLPQEASRYATAVVVGEAENTWPKVIEDFEAGEMAGVYENEDLMDLDDLPRPRRDLYGDYPASIIKTTRGCPFNCDFCCISTFNRQRYRLRPVDDVVDEMKEIKHKVLFVADDNIVGSGRPRDDERALALFEGMVRRQTNKMWGSQASINVAKNHEMMRMMRKAGCASLLIGFEALETSALKGRGKYQNVQMAGNEAYYSEVVKTLHSYGIAVNGFFFNSHEDTRASFERMADFLAKSDIDLVTHTILTPLPGTTLFDNTLPKLCYKRFPTDWEKYDFSRLMATPTHMTRSEFYKTRHRMIKRTHSWPRILRIAFQGLLHSRSPLMAFLLLVSHYNQRKSFSRELRRNLAELNCDTHPTAFESISMY